MKVRNILVLVLVMVVMLTTLTACVTETPVGETAAPVQHHPDFPNVDTTGMTDLQKAVVLTAESFVIRRERGQYDDTRLIDSSALAYYRWSAGQRQPEDYTSQFTGYSNCAAFVYDLYRAALDLDIKYYTTATLTSGSATVLFKTPVLSGFSSMNESQLEEQKQAFLSALQPGDLIVYRYAEKASGHAMCYVGNNMMIHCSGSNYNYEAQEEKYEEQGCFRYESIDKFWDKESDRYLFNKNSYVIIRPLDSFAGEIPQRTLDRMGVMRGVVAEKTASAAWTQTVSPGQEVRFTFTLENLTGYNKTLTITDTVPANTTYITGAQEKNGDALSWSVALGAGETAEVSYTVQVGEQAKVVESSSFVENISVNCPAITVGKTLTTQEQDALTAAAAKADLSSDGIALAAAIYQEALGKEILSGTTADDVLEGVFRYYAERIESGAASDGKWPSQWRALDRNGEFFDLVAPGLYGGRNVLEGTDASPVSTTGFMAADRVRMVAEDQLIPGDIIVVNDDADGFRAFSWLYVDGQLLDLQTGEMTPVETFLSQLICRKHFVVIRPSLGM